MGKRKREKERKERMRRSKRSHFDQPVTVNKKIPLKMVISGGQTGADQGALWGANNSGLDTGGTAPKGWITEDGPNPKLREFGLKEHSSEKYPERTKLNVKNSDGTLWVGVPDTKGGKVTLAACSKFGRPYLAIPYQWSYKVEQKHPVHYAKEIKAWIEENGIKTLNVAGNRESINYGITGFTAGLIKAVVGEMKYPGFYVQASIEQLAKEARKHEEDRKHHDLKMKMRNEPRRRLDDEPEEREPRRRLYPPRRRL